MEGCSSCKDWDAAIREQQDIFLCPCACGHPACLILRQNHPAGFQARPLAENETQREMELSEMGLEPSIIKHVMSIRNSRTGL
jgi:hypothetical protein